MVKFTDDNSIDKLRTTLELAIEIEALIAIGIDRKGKHTKERKGYLNSGYLRRIDTKYGSIEFKKPRVVFKEKGIKLESKLIENTREEMKNLLI